MALMKLRGAKDSFLLNALAQGKLILNQHFPEPCSKQMELGLLRKIMGDGVLFYDNSLPIVEVKTEPTKQTKFSPEELIMYSAYGEFPDTVTTLKLAALEARIDNRNPDDAMRICAGLLMKRVQNKRLHGTLWKMTGAGYPSNLMVDIESAIKNMVKHLREELGEVIHADGPEELVELLFKKRT